MPDQSPQDKAAERQWIEAIRQGDRTAFEALFQAYYSRLCAYVEAQGHAPEVAEDLVQDLFLDLWQRRKRLNVQGPPRAYLYGAARNKAIKWVKRRQVRERWKQEEKQRDRPTLPGPDVHAHYREVERYVESCIDELPERRRQVFILSRQHGLTYREIAKTMGITPKTVENQMVRALKFLRERLATLLSLAA